MESLFADSRMWQGKPGFFSQLPRFWVIGLNQVTQVRELWEAMTMAYPSSCLKSLVCVGFQEAKQTAWKPELLWP